MTTLGVSVYPEMRPLKEIRKYLAQAASYGFTRVFTSMFSMLGSSAEVLATFSCLIDAAHEHGMEVSLDIDLACMDRLGATPNNLEVFANIGANILRMDGAYDEDNNVLMLQNVVPT